MQQLSGSQQPIQFQNIEGQAQVSLLFNGNPAGQPLYYIGNPHQQYVQDPVKMAYATLPTQPYPTSFTPQIYGGNVLTTPQQVGDDYLTLSVLMTFLVLIIGGWPSLLCTIPALLISYNAKEDEKRGNIAAARTKANISLGLNITAVVFVVVMLSAVAIPVAVTVSAQTSTTQPPYCYSTQSSLYYCTQSSCYTYCSYYYYYSDSPDSYSYSYYSYSYYSFSRYCILQTTS
ncbi:hypothetical protein EMCRGX_G022859 [Ephydatia muelleri]